MFFCSFEGLPVSPLSYFFVVAAQEDVRDFRTAKELRPCVLWIFEQAGTERIVLGRIFVAEGAG